MSSLNATHDPSRTSWLDSANGHPDFPIQNLPLGVAKIGQRIAIVTAIGDSVLPLPQALTAKWGDDLPEGLRRALFGDRLNHLGARPPAEWSALRAALSEGLSDSSWESRLRPQLMSFADVEMRLPFVTGDYTDFYASIHHARNVGALFRPDQPLLPNYQWVPIGYHGRASSLVVHGTPIRRPRGQTKAPDAASPEVVPSRSLDYELELGIFLGGHNTRGTAVDITTAGERIFGCCLLNDWSARDIQSWEYQPLGPFLSKNFATTISPWVVTAEALRPFAVGMPARPADEPQPLPYLQGGDDATWSISLAVGIRSLAMQQRGDKPAIVSRIDYANAMYWSPAQLITHHASGGCELNAGDLLGSGTVSGPGIDERGCLLERTSRGRDRITIGEETRGFLEDGDEVSMRGSCQRDGAVSIGFGSCTGVVKPS